MKNLIANNAYGILGLLPNATQKELSKRVKDLEKLSQIGEIPHYKYDFEIYAKMRDLKHIKEAQQELNLAQKRILHSFFRLYINSQNDENLANLQGENELLQMYETKKTWDFISLKNFALIMSLFLLKNGENVKFCLNLWEQILNSKRYLDDFKTLFLHSDELGVTHFENLKEQILNEIGIFFDEVAKKHKDKAILTEFIKAFEYENLESDEISRIYDEINKKIKTLEKMEISADGEFDDDEKALLKSSFRVFKKCFNELKEFGLYESTKSLLIRDEVAKVIREHVLDLNNNLSQSKEALNLVSFAIKIVGTQALKSKLEQDIEALQDIEWQKSFADFVDEITEFIDDIKNRKLWNLNSRISEVKELCEEIRKDKDYVKNERKFKRDLGINSSDSLLNSFAIRIRNIAIDIANEQKYQEAKSLLNLALQISDNADLKARIKKDLNDADRIALDKLNKSIDKTSNIASWIFWIIVIIVAIKACK